jgi:hypothetical protein
MPAVSRIRIRQYARRVKHGQGALRVPMWQFGAAVRLVRRVPRRQVSHTSARFARERREPVEVCSPLNAGVLVRSGVNSFARVRADTEPPPRDEITKAQSLDRTDVVDPDNGSRRRCAGGQCRHYVGDASTLRSRRRTGADDAWCPATGRREHYQSSGVASAIRERGERPRDSARAYRGESALGPRTGSSRARNTPTTGGFWNAGRAMASC